MAKKNLSWWDAAEQDVCGAVQGTVGDIIADDAMRMQSITRANRLWCAGGLVDTDQAASENMFREIVATVSARTVRSRPAVRVTTEQGNWNMGRRAATLDRWLRGQFEEHSWHQDVAPRALQSALLYGTGCALVGHDGEQIVVEHVPVWELKVDRAEGTTGAPRNMYRVRYASAPALAEMYPQWSREILAAAGAVDDRDDPTEQYSTYSGRGDLVRLTEAWHLGSGRRPGRYVLIAGDSAVLQDAEWMGKRFPFCTMRYCTRTTGFWGTGVGDEIGTAQLELNRLSDARFEALRLMGMPYVLVENGSGVDSVELNNMLGRVVHYTGTPPRVVNPETVSQTVLEHSQQLRSTMQAATGLNDMSMTGMKPAGLESGRALRAYHDMQSERLIQISLQYEQFTVQCAELMCQAAEELRSAGKNPSTVYIDSLGMQKLKWADIGMNTDDYRLQAVPVSALSSTVAGRIEDIDNLIRIGAITDPDTVQELVNVPDLKSSQGGVISARDLANWICETRILDDGEVPAVDPLWPHMELRKWSTKFLYRCQVDGAPPDRLRLLKLWIGRLDEVLTAQQQQQMAAQQEAMAQMAAQPGTAEQSNRSAMAAPATVQ